MPCRQSKDKDGTTYHIAAATTGKTPGGHQFPGTAAVDVWWSRRLNAHKSDETLFIRQSDGEHADIIELTQGQVYDLIHALGWAILKP